jgi:hypothetical protein
VGGESKGLIPWPEQEWNVKIQLKWAAFGSGLALVLSATGFIPGMGQGLSSSSLKRSLSSVRTESSTGMKITRDAALYDRIKQLDLERTPAPSFEDDLSRLSSQESRHHEKLPGLASHPRLKSVVKRLSAGPYAAKRR